MFWLQMFCACSSAWPHMQTYSFELLCATSAHLFACFAPPWFPSQKLWLCKSSPPLLNLQVAIEMIRWIGGSNAKQYKYLCFIAKVGLCSLYVERIRRRTCVVKISWSDPWFAALEVISVWSLYLSRIVLSQIFIHLICICPAPQLSPSRDQEQGASKVFLEILAKIKPSTQTLRAARQMVDQTLNQTIGNAYK